MQAELSYGRLPWAHINDMAQVGKQKQAIRKSVDKLFPSPCPREFHDIFNYVSRMKYYDNPDYQMIYGVSGILELNISISNFRKCVNRSLLLDQVNRHRTIGKLAVLHLMFFVNFF